MSFDIRVLDSEEDLVAASSLFRTAMIGIPPLSNLQTKRITQLFEPGRTIGAFVDGQLVGTADALSGGLTLPGGAIVGHAGVTHVGVHPSFVRRGIATELMRHQLHDMAERGEVVATLRASEATIYERFGYGVASSMQTIEVPTARAALRPDLGSGGPVRLLPVAEAAEVLPRICAEHRPTRPGTIDRPTTWSHSLRIRAESDSGASYIAVHGEPGAESGFARYRPTDTETWFTNEQRTVAVEDFFAPTPEAYLGLLRFLLGLDLVHRVQFWMMPVDDPLPWLLLDRRAAKVAAVYDETWLRVVDVAKAVTARGYLGDGSVTVAINDPLLQHNSGTYTISADGAEPTDQAAQLHIGIEGLGAVLLGGATWRSLAVAGLVRADDTDAIAVADRLFAVPEAPFVGFYF